MPSPVGHALAGVAVAWGADLVPGRRAWRIAPADACWYRKAGDGLTVVCLALAAIPDADLLTSSHRTFSHSISSVVVVALVAAVAAAWAHRPVVRIAGMSGAAYASHLFLDWLGVDTTPPEGIQVFWPFAHAWFISGFDLFRATERENLFSAQAFWTNVLAVTQEIVLLAPVLVALWLVRVKALSRLPS